MKRYEHTFNHFLTWRMPIVIRLDGKTFHTFTSGMERPFDDLFIENMQKLTKYLCKEISTTVFAYCQSDEISLLLVPYKKLDTEPWFLNEIQKMCSVSAGIASSYFSLLYGREAVFDARCFILPEAEIANYYHWRQSDCSTNSISMVAQSKFSHKELQGKGSNQMQEMLFQKHKINWNNLPIYKKRGFACYKKLTPKKIVIPVVKKKIMDGFIEGSVESLIQAMDWQIDLEIPIFSKRRSFISKWLKVEEN